MPVSPPVEELGDQRRLGYDETAVAAALTTLVGREARIDKPFRCVLPGHEERNPSASIYRDPSTGLFLYRDWHRRDGHEWCTLAEARAAQGYKHCRKLRSPEAARWYTRLFFEAGILVPEPVDLPPLPSGARRALRKVAAGFALLLGLRWLQEELGAPTPFGRTFAAAWCGVTPRTAEEAKLELLKLGVISKVGQHGRMSLYLPGDGRRVRRSAGALGLARRDR